MPIAYLLAYYSKIPETLEELHYLVQKIAIIIIYDTEKKVICARAQSLSTTPCFSIVGGVETFPQYRKQGLSTYICAKLTEFLRKESREISLSTDLENLPARKTYEKLGYIPSGKSIYFDKNTKMIELSTHFGERDY